MDVEHALPEGDRLAAMIARIDRPIVLVGMMGVGKSSLGRKLAALLGAPFVDADDAIEEAAQMSIPEIFAAYGEDYFRDGERRVLARLLGEGDSPGDTATGPGPGPGPSQHPSQRPSPRPPGQITPRAPGLKIIATGGGAFCHPQTRELILRRGIAVWLDAELDTLVERTSRKDNRPLLRDGNPREILARLKASRQPFYAQAPIHVMSGNGPHSRTMARVLADVEKWLDAREAAARAPAPSPATSAPAQET